MRDVLTGIAILVIVVLTTALVAPYFIDWNNQRTFLEARLTHALGQKVTIGGNIDLKLLPTPYLILDQVVIGGDDARMRLGVHHLDLELTVAPLFHGEFDITQARLEEPTLRLVLDTRRTLPNLPSAPAFSADVRFDRIQVSNGTLTIADTLSGRTFVADHIDLDAEAASFAGPFKISGAAQSVGNRRTFRLATGAFEKAQARTHFILDEAGELPRFDLDGTLTLPSAGAGDPPTFRGTIASSGHLPDAGNGPPPWALTGNLVLSTNQATLDGGELRFGTDDAGLTLTAGATARFDETAALALTLAAKQIDFDRLSGPASDPTNPNPPPLLPEPAALRRLLTAMAPPLPTALDLTIETATYGGEAFNDLAVHIGPTGTPTQHFEASGDGPGGTHLALDGALRLDPGAFEGHVTFNAEDLPRAFGWLHGVAPWFTADGANLPVRRLALKGTLSSDPGHVVAKDLTAELDTARVSGTASLDFASATPHLAARLAADRFALGTLPSPANLRSAVSGIDLDVALAADNLEVAAGDGPPVHIGGLRASLIKRGQKIEAKDIHASDIGGATLDASGMLDGEQGLVQVKLAAQRLDGVAATLGRLAPGPLADAMASRAGLLAPADVTIDAASLSMRQPTGPGSHLTITGHFADTAFSLAAQPDPHMAGGVTIAASVRAAEARTLLAQLRGIAPTGPPLGSGHIALQASGPAGKPLDATLIATLGATRVDINGRYNLLSPTLAGSGTLDLQSGDAADLFGLFAGTEPPLRPLPAHAHGNLSIRDTVASLINIDANVAGTTAKGALQFRRASDTFTGSLDLDKLSLPTLVRLTFGPSGTTNQDELWSAAAFGRPMADPPATNLTLRADVLDLGQGILGRDARLDLGLSAGTTTFSHASADVLGGRVSGDVTLRRDGRIGSVEGKITMNQVGVRLPSLVTRLDGDLSFAGNGASPRAIVASLAGSGNLSAEPLRISRADDAALIKTFADIEGDILSVDPETVTRSFEQAAHEPQLLGHRQFSVGLASGGLRFTPVEVGPQTGEVAHRPQAKLDLVAGTLDIDLEETLRRLPKDWKGPPPSVTLHVAGPLQRPAYSVSVDNLLNALAARALARETARVEAYEFDIRERAFFNARLDRERQRVDDAKAEAERKAREAARLEQQRQEAAKAAREKANGGTGLTLPQDFDAPLNLPGANR